MTNAHGATSPLDGLKPREGVSAQEVTPDGSIFAATGVDPQMIWRPSKLQRAELHQRSAVRVRIHMRALEGRLSEPCIYVDWGDGFSEETRKPLSLSERGVYVAVAHTNAGACRQIRVDPTSSEARFVVSGFSVEPAAAPSINTPTLSLPRRLLRRILRHAPLAVQNALQSARQLFTGAAAGGVVRRRILDALASGRANAWRTAYARSFDVARDLRSPDFAAPPLSAPARDPEGARIVAFYLPQYHPIPQNDAWWGKGFTEWANVTKAVPQFLGHLQPRLPADLGYYDLRVPETRHAQVDLARRVGVDAFCFHYYWFAGQRLLEAPLDAFAADPTIDMPFALCWANENWTRRWDGKEYDVLISQAHSPEDDLAVFDDMAGYMRHSRYLKVGDRALLVVYRPDILPDAGATVARWRRRARELGLGELFLLCTDAFGFTDYAGYDFDGLVEFPPHAITIGEVTHQLDLLNPAYSGRVYDYEAVVAAKVGELLEREDPRHVAGLMPAWDNEARKPGASHVFHNASPELFRRWLTAALACARRIAPREERLVFINAWNEWAEGAYLEPDRWFGHGFAQAVRASLESSAPIIGPDHPLLRVSSGFERRCEAVVLLHVYYPELIEHLAASLQAVRGRLDVAASFPQTWSAAELQRLVDAFPGARLTPVPNAGRDVAPFIHALPWVRSAGYPIFCKLHSKRSPHMADGDLWRDRLICSLVGTDAVERVQAEFAGDPKLGMVASSDSKILLGDPDVLYSNRDNLEHLGRRLGFTFGDETPFAAGTMFWGRTAAFDVLTSPQAQSLSFEIEMGRIDGTLAHALERAMAAIVAAAQYKVKFSLGSS